MLPSKSGENKVARGSEEGNRDRRCGMRYEIWEWLVREAAHGGICRVLIVCKERVKEGYACSNSAALMVIIPIVSLLYQSFHSENLSSLSSPASVPCCVHQVVSPYWNVPPHVQRRKLQSKNTVRQSDT